MTKLKLGAALLSALLLLQACGSNGNGDTSLAEEITVDGVAAIGAAIVGGDVRLRCRSDVERTATTDASGGWSVTVPSAALPCAVRVSGGTAGDAPNGDTFYSLAISRDGVVNANNTPLTDLLLARALAESVGAELDAWFDGGTLDSTLLQVEAAARAAIATLREELVDAGYSVPDDFDPFLTSLAPGVPTDLYDSLLDALGEVLRREGISYAEARDSYRSGAALPEREEGGGTAPPRPVDTTLAAGEAGLRFATTGTVLGAAENQKLRFWPQDDLGDVGADEAVLQVVVQGTEANASLGLRNLPNTFGRFDCGDPLSAELPLNIELEFATGHGYSSVGTRGVPGYNCTIEIHQIGTRDGAGYDGVLAGRFLARLNKTGVAPDLDTSIHVQGHFRLPSTPPAATTLATKIALAAAGTYVLDCPVPGAEPVRRTVVIAEDGSSTLDGNTFVGAGAGNGGEVQYAANAGGPQLLIRRTSAGSAGSIALRFRPDGTLGTTSQITTGGGQPFGGCTPVSGTIDASALDLAAAVGSYVRSEELLNCSGSSASPPVSGATTFSISNAGVMLLGSLGAAPTADGTDLLDGVTFPGSSPRIQIELYNSSASNLFLRWVGSAATPALTNEVRYQQGFGAHSGTCTP